MHVRQPAIRRARGQHAEFCAGAIIPVPAPRWCCACGRVAMSEMVARESRSIKRDVSADDVAEAGAIASGHAHHCQPAERDAAHENETNRLMN